MAEQADTLFQCWDTLLGLWLSSHLPPIQANPQAPGSPRPLASTKVFQVSVESFV